MKRNAVLGAVLAALLVGVSSSSARQSDELPYPFDTSPLWSADGTKIAFLRNFSGSWTVRTVGSTSGGVDVLGTLPAGASYPSLSPDFSKVAFTFENGVRIMRVNGSAFRQISVSPGSIHWSRDNRYLALGTIWAKVVVIDTETGATTEVADGRDPAWSPDGSQLAFVSGTDIATANRDGTGRRVVRAGTQWSGPPAWSPEGQRLAFPSDYSLWVVKLDGTVLEQKGGHYVTNMGASWSSDGTKVGVVNQPVLSIFDLRNGKEKRLRLTSTSPVWGLSPDLFAVAAPGPCSWTGIHVVSATSGTKRRLTLDCLIDGTRAGEILEGSEDCDLIRGRRGNDRIFGFGCGDTIYAGPGNDWVTGGPYQDGDENDYVDGGPGSDVLDGGRGPTFGHSAIDDTLLGRAGSDVLRGGPGRDLISGGVGNDTIYAGDGDVDQITCGPGRDFALVDKDDRVPADCEVVRVKMRR